jgi:hypothetical protein
MGNLKYWVNLFTEVHEFVFRGSRKKSQLLEHPGKYNCQWQVTRFWKQNWDGSKDNTLAQGLS